MIKSIEKIYSKIFNHVAIIVNPFKKVIIKTECTIHKFINEQALIILKNDKYIDAYNFFSDYIKELNDGAVWADQDFKSSGHFYNPVRKRGLFGNTDALTLANNYYCTSLRYWKKNKIKKSIFYLGATVHLVQDMTIPQHANIRLLDNHRQFENFIKKTNDNALKFVADRGGYYRYSIEEFIRCNAKTAIKIYSKLKHIKDDEKRYLAISKSILPLAQKTTAGCLLKFYRDKDRLNK